MTTTPTTVISNCYAGLAADDWGLDDHRAPLLLLHGLTFDRSIWRGIVRDLQHRDPKRRVVSLDLPGHGDSPDQTSYDLLPVTERIHAAAQHAGLSAPVIVGHSIAAGIASAYAANYPSSGVVNVDGSPVIEPIAVFLRSIAERLRSPEFATLWQVFYDSFHVELLPVEARELVAATCRPRQQVALGYWRALLDDPIEQVNELIDRSSAALAEAAVPYLYLAGAALDPDTKAWMARQSFTPEIEEWQASGHFPHLAHPARFVALLAATSDWAARSR